MAEHSLAALLPPVNEQNRPYWEGCAAGELRLQRCEECGTFRYPDSPRCPRCLSPRSTWQSTSGRGELWSWIVLHQRYFDAFADQLPYPVLWIRLDEGPFMMTGLVGEVSGLRIGQRMEVVFEQAVPGRTVPNFRVAP